MTIPTVNIHHPSCQQFPQSTVTTQTVKLSNCQTVKLSNSSVPLQHAIPTTTARRAHTYSAKALGQTHRKSPPASNKNGEPTQKQIPRPHERQYEIQDFIPRPLYLVGSFFPLHTARCTSLSAAPSNPPACRQISPPNGKRVLPTNCRSPQCHFPSLPQA
jgi:hypothetical protein